MRISGPKINGHLPSFQPLLNINYYQPSVGWCEGGGIICNLPYREQSKTEFVVNLWNTSSERFVNYTYVDTSCSVTMNLQRILVDVRVAAQVEHCITHEHKN